MSCNNLLNSAPLIYFYWKKYKKINFVLCTATLLTPVCHTVFSRTNNS